MNHEGNVPRTMELEAQQNIPAVINNSGHRATSDRQVASHREAKAHTPRGLELYGSATWESDGRGYLDLQRVADVPVSHFLFTRCDEILRLHRDPTIGYGGATHYLAGGTLVRPSSCVLFRVLYRHGGHAPYQPSNMLYHLETCQQDLQDHNKVALLSQVLPQKRLRGLQRLASYFRKKRSPARDSPFLDATGKIVGPGLVVTTRTSFGGDSVSTGAQGWTVNGHEVLEIGCSVPRQAFMWHINIRHPWRGIIDGIEIRQAGQISPLLEKPLVKAALLRRVASVHLDVLYRVASYCGLYALLKLRCLSRAARAAAEMVSGVASSGIPSQLHSLEYCFLQRHCFGKARMLNDSLGLAPAALKLMVLRKRPVVTVPLWALLNLESEPTRFAADLISRLDLKICISPPPQEDHEADSPSPLNYLRIKFVLANQCRWANSPGLPVHLRSLHQNDPLYVFVEYRGKSPTVGHVVNWMKEFTCTITAS